MGLDWPHLPRWRWHLLVFVTPGASSAHVTGREGGVERDGQSGRKGTSWKCLEPELRLEPEPKDTADSSGYQQRDPGTGLAQGNRLREGKMSSDLCVGARTSGVNQKTRFPAPCISHFAGSPGPQSAHQ